MASANQLAAARPGSPAEMRIEHLHYGKLVTDDGRVPSLEGYGVTRRSEGLDTEDDALLRVSALLDVRRFEPDLIDASAAGRGVLVVRWLGPTSGRPARVAIVRARFRSEDGDGSAGRIHQQASIWIASNKDWMRHPATLLEAAAGLRAEPDHIDTPRAERIGAPARSLPLDARETDGSGNLSRTARRIVDFLLPAKGRDAKAAARSLLFGGDVFDDEASFLETVGAALQSLPPGFGGWPDIAIACGLKHALGTVSIRYLHSERTALPDSLDEEAPAPGPSPLAKVRSEPAHNEKVSAGRERLPASYFEIPPSADALINAFQREFRAYRDAPSASAAARLIQAAAALGESRDPQRAVADEALASFLDRNEMNAFRSLDAGRAPVGELALGHLLDLAELYGTPNLDPGLRGRSDEILKAVCQRLADLKVWLPAELDKLKSSAFMGPLLGRIQLAEAYDASETLNSFLAGAADRGTVATAPDPRDVLEAIERLSARLDAGTSAAAKGTRSLDVGCLGIHGKYPAWLDAILVPRSYLRSVEEVLSRIAPAYVSLLRSPG